MTASKVRAWLLSLVTLVVITPPAAAAAQDGPRGWSITAGGGAALSASGTARNDTGNGIGLQVMVSRERAGTGIGLLFEGIWLDGLIANEKRHMVAGVVTYRPASIPVALMVGPGIGMATSVTVEGPPAPPAVGDVDIGVGDDAAVGFIAGASLRVPVMSGLDIEPGVDIVVHHLGGRFLNTILAGGRIRLK